MRTQLVLYIRDQIDRICHGIVIFDLTWPYPALAANMLVLCRLASDAPFAT